MMTVDPITSKLTNDIIFRMFTDDDRFKLAGDIVEEAEDAKKAIDSTSGDENSFKASLFIFAS